MFSNYQIIDLTHTLDEHVLSWDGDCGFKQCIAKDYDVGCRVYHFADRPVGMGTHIDAPAHFIPNAMTIDELALKNLLVPARIINVAAQAHADYLISPEDILVHEKQYGKIPPQNLVIFYTGWSQHWSDMKRYRNEDQNQVMHFPTVSLAAAELLLQRDIVGIAIDTYSPDAPKTKFPVHHLLLGANKYIIENIANANLLPAVGTEIIALPMKISDGTEAPLRIIGLVKS